MTLGTDPSHGRLTRMTVRSTQLLLAALSLTLVACAGQPGASPTPTGSPPPSATPAPTPSPSPIADGATVVLRIEQTGGMMPPWETLRWYPSVVLYADGRLIMQGPQIAIYPGPALPNLQVTHLSADGVAQVLQWAAQAGLEGPDRQLGPMILDAGELVFTVTTPAGTHRTSVTDMSAGDPEIGAVRQFQGLMGDLRAWLADEIVGDDTPYVADRLRVISFPADAANQPDPNLVTTLAWPLEPMATHGTSYGEPAEYRCVLIEGDDLATLMPLLQQSNELTLWESEDATYQIYAHPLLPDDLPCPGFDF